jgi:hypothetical protein
MTLAALAGGSALPASAAEDLVLGNPTYRMAYDYLAYQRQADATPAAEHPSSAPAAATPSAPGAVAASPWCATPACGDPCAAACGDGVGCGDGCGGGGWLSGCPIIGAAEGFTLASLVGLDDSAYVVGGWTQFGYHSNNTPLSQARGDLLAFNDVPDALNLHQQWFYVGREVDGSRGFDLGGRADFIYGTDAQKTQAFSNPPNSFDEGWDHGVYGWAIPQLYAEVAMGDLSVKVGKFFTLIGYEVVGAPGNFFYSHSLTMFNSEPFTHTGALATYSGFDNVTLYGGWTAGWDTGFDSVNSGSNFLGGLSMGLGEFVTFTYMNTYGNFGLRGDGADDSYSHSVLFDVALTDNLQYVFQSDVLRINNEATGYSEDDFGINQYVFLTLTDTIKLGQRIEWWKDEGVSHYESTSGVNIQLLDNLVFRPEYRVDWAPGTDIDERTFGMDMVLTY